MKPNTKSKNSADKYNFDDLISIMRALRDPNSGCPWDLEQNFKSIAPYTIEEAYEVADAIDRNNLSDLREELGDLLLQPVYHAQLATEANEFSINDVINDICAKMISRHPHVFGDQAAVNAAEVDKIWEQRKAAEKSHQDSVLDGITLGLPALLRAQKLQKRAAKTGFEWTHTKDIINKIDEELKELQQALDNKNAENIAEEIGDLLFVIANLARQQNLNAETLLRDANSKFERRFRAIEAEIAGKTLEEMQDAWNRNKLREPNPPPTKAS